MSGTYGARSTPPSVAGRCRPCGGPGTCWRSTVAKADGAAAAGGAGWAAGRAAGRWWLRHGLGPMLVRWWRRRGLRSRVTLTAALGLIVAFAAADLLLFNALRVSLTNSTDDYARSGATQVAALINAGRLPDPVPVAP